MPNLTLAIPDDLKARMGRFPEINWSEVARQAIVEKARVLDEMQRLLRKSNLTKSETLSLGQNIKKRVWQKHRRST
jgi:hypothetical protein